MTRNPPGHNCHGVALDVFMTMIVRHRWEEVRDMFPDWDAVPPLEPQKIDESWIGLRYLETRTERDWIGYNQSFQNWRKRKNRPILHRDCMDPSLLRPLRELKNLAHDVPTTRVQTYGDSDAKYGQPDAKHVADYAKKRNITPKE